MKLVYLLGFLSLVAAGSHKKRINEEEYYKRNKHKKIRIAGGTEAFIFDMPYMASLVAQKPTYKAYFHELACTAVIIHPFWVLTSSSCLENIDAVDHHLLTNGSYLIRSNTAWADGSTDMYRDHAIEEWHTKNLFHDSNSSITRRLLPMGRNLGLVKVKTEFKRAYEKPIDIVPRNYKYKVGSSAIQAGWGATENNSFWKEDMPSPRLRKIDTRLTDYENCRRFHRYFDANLPGQPRLVYSDMVCTYSAHGKNTCGGDGGGPLIQDGKLIGILGYERLCNKFALNLFVDTRDWPDVYTKVANYVGWIEDTIFNATKVPQRRYRTQKTIG